MAIGMIEFQGSIQRTQDFTALKQQENTRPAVDQRVREVVKGDDTNKGENHADAKEKGKGQYAGDGGAGRKKKDISKEGKVVLKGTSHFDMSI